MSLNPTYLVYVTLTIWETVCQALYITALNLTAALPGEIVTIPILHMRKWRLISLDNLSESTGLEWKKLEQEFNFHSDGWPEWHRHGTAGGRAQVDAPGPWAVTGCATCHTAVICRDMSVSVC